LDFESQTRTLLDMCDHQADIWRRLQPEKFEITEPHRSEKLRILFITLGYVGRTLELYDDVKSALDNERYLSSVILARSSVESAAMICAFYTQVKKNFQPHISDHFSEITNKHTHGLRHKIGENIEQLQGLSVTTAIEKSDEFAKDVKDVIFEKFDYLSNVDVLVPGAKAIDYKVVAELGPFGWIYSWLSELTHPNPIGNRRYFSESISDDDIISDEMMRFAVAEGLSKNFYAGFASNFLFSICTSKSVDH
jgi:hypothetical protein